MKTAAGAKDDEALRRREAKEVRLMKDDQRAIRQEMAEMRSEQESQLNAIMQAVSQLSQKVGDNSVPTVVDDETPALGSNTPRSQEQPFVGFPATSSSLGWALPVRHSSNTVSASSTTTSVLTVPIVTPVLGGPSTSSASLPLPAASQAAPSLGGTVLAATLQGGSHLVTPSSCSGFNVGQISGPRVSLALREKIWNGHYVSFYDLLHPDLENPAELATQSSKVQKKVLSSNQWHRAFLCFVGIRAEKFPQDVTDLLKYGGYIGELMEQRVDWALYDARFRWDKATDPNFHDAPWSQIRQQIVNEAFLKHEERSSEGQSFRAIQAGIPKGYCFKYHEGGSSSCASKSCFFNHNCPKCSGNHPLYRHHSSRSYRRSSPSRNKDHSHKSAYPNKERRRQ